MRFPIFCLLLLCPLIADSGVYKWIGADGQVQYSDRPAEGAERLPITSGARKKEDVQRNDGETRAKLGPYNSFEIVNPEKDATIRDPDGNVPVGMVIEPPLKAGHRLRIDLDGQPVQGNVPGPQMLLQGVSIGSHSIRALIIDEQEAPVAETPAVDFHLRKPLPKSALP